MSEEKLDNNENYSASSIQVLEGLEAVRKRPAMYIGDISTKGLHHLVYEVVDNSIDEALAGYASNIYVTINEDNSITVEDDGRGIPVDMHEKEGKSALEVVLTVLHAGGKFNKDSYKVSGGLHGVGVSCVNALSTYLRAEVRRDGKVHVQEYSKGHPQTDVQIVGETDKTGTIVTFLPDDTIFTDTVYQFQILAGRLRDLAFLNAGIHLTLTDKREIDAEGNAKCEHYYSADGLKEFVQYVDSSKEHLFEDIIHINTERQGVPVEVAMTYNTSYNENLFSYVNNINTIEGGTHVAGFRRALTRTLKKYAEDSKMLEKVKVEISAEDFREGLTAVISVKVMEPQFEGQTKTKLGNSEVRGIVDSLVNEQLTLFFEQNPSVIDAILEKCILAAKARIAARKAKENTRRKSGMDSFGLPGKLADCSSKKPEECEVYIVEGDSAGGSAKQGRDPRIQAILPLWGKMLNVEKVRPDKVINNEKLQPVIASLGAGFGKDFNIEKLRYHKIIIMADADVDGAHIATLLMTFFFRYMPQLIEEGHIYIAMPPLYRVEYKKDRRFVFSDEERDAAIADFVSKGVSNDKLEVQRYKGLGEMEWKELKETTMDPTNRRMKRVSITDAIEADRIFTTLMGEEVEPRRKFIEENAIYATLDV